MLCLTEAIAIKAVMVPSKKHVISIDDKFASRFIFIVNFGFTFGSHMGLYVLGSLGYDELLTGRVKSKETTVSLFYLIISGIVCFIVCFSTLSITFKKFAACQKVSKKLKGIGHKIRSKKSLVPALEANHS